MRIRVAVVEAVDAGGQRWLVEVVPSGGEQGAVDVKAEPGYVDPAPVELAPGVKFLPVSEVDGTWQIGLKGVGEVRCSRADGSFPAASQPLAASGGSSGLPVTPTRSDLDSGATEGVAKLLAFRYGVPPVEGEGGWARLTHEQQGHWEQDAEMVLGYLEHSLGWKKPQVSTPVDTGDGA